MSLFGGIEAGGTKFICGIGTGPGDLRTEQFATAAPDVTIRQVIDFFQKEAPGGLTALGVGSFGPIDLHPASPTFGYITSTPKLDWRNFDLCGALTRELGVPIGFDTDVAAAALGEARWGAAQDISDIVYLTIGTGIGGAALFEGRILHGLLHAEMGHIRIPHDRTIDPYEGCCPYHGDCWEGLACGPAMEARWGIRAVELPEDHPAWQLEARYLALALANITFILSPQRILLGGGVMQQAHLFDLIRAEFIRLLNGYIRHESILSNLKQYLAPPLLGGRAGVLGALVLAEQAHRALTSLTSISDQIHS